MFDQNRKLKESTELYLELADAIHKAYPDDPARRAAALALVPGMDQEMLNILIKGRAEAEKYIAAARAAGAATKDNADQAQRIETAWARAGLAIHNFGRQLVNEAGPLLERLAKLTEATFTGLSNITGLGKGTGDQNRTGVDLRMDAARRAANGESVGWLDTWRKYRQRVLDSQKEKEQQKKTEVSSPSSVSMTKADRNHNPGNIEYGDFAKRHGAIGTDGRFAIFPTREAGFKAAEALLATKGYRDLNLPQIGSRWAEGDPNWAKNASRATGIPMNRPLTDEERTRLARVGMPAAEGSAIPGSNPGATGNTTTTNQTTTVGTIVIHTAATDAKGIARDIEPALRRNSMATPANTGQM